MEEWKVITFAPKYEVSNMGRIRNAKTKRILSTKPTKSHKHPQVFLHGCGVFPKMQFTVSHIVYDHFVGEEGFNNTTGNWNARIMHYDGNILNNNSNNLFRRY
jgi:hypothetical protein